MAINPIPLGLRSNPNRNDTQAQLINCYAEELGEENQSRTAIYACDGYEAFATLTGSGAGVTRGMFALDDTTLYVVTGQRINRVTTGGVVTDMGAFATSGYAYMARNRKDPNAQIAIVTSDQLWRIIENNVITTPTLPSGVTGWNSVCSIDGYHIYTAANGEWFVSSIDAGDTVDELDFAQAQSNPDGIVRGLVRGRDLLIAGPRSIEVYQNTGATDFPFERVTSITIGVAYAPTMVNLAAVIEGGLRDVVIFAANNADGSYAGVVVMDGYEARKISLPWIDRAIRDETDKTSLRAFTYARNGHVFYTLTGSTFTAEYNATTGLWHTRKSSGLARWRPVDAASFNGNVIFGDYTSAALYKARHDIAPSAASTVTMRHSNDGGSTWKTGRTKAVGTDKTKTLDWHAMGMSKKDGKVFELTFSNALYEAAVGTDMQVITPPVASFPRPMIFDALYCNATMGTSLANVPKGFYSLQVDATAVEA